MTPEEEIYKAQQAQDLLDNQLVKEFLSVIKQNLLRDFENSKADQKDAREELWRMLKVVNEFERHFLSIVTTGEMAKKQMSASEKFRNKVRSMF